MGIRGRAEGQRGHDFFWLVKQRDHGFFPPAESNYTNKRIRHVTFLLRKYFKNH